MNQYLTIITITIIFALSVNISEARLADSEFSCPGGVWTGQKCKSCWSGGDCKTCDGNIYGSRCESVSKTYGIQGCSQGCLSTGTQTAVCTQCYDWWYFKDSGLCINCPNDCQTCSAKGVCTECNDNFYLTQNQCVSPTSLTVPSNCAKWQDKATCQQCKSGFFLKSQTSCQACSANCLSCTDGTTCTLCKTSEPITGLGINPKVYLLSGGKCVLSTLDNCLEFTLDGTTQKCTQCYTDYYLKDAQCLKKPTGCETEDSTDPANKCTVCLDGYYLTGSSKTCTQCNGTGIWRCQDETQDILQCREGFALLKSGTTTSCVVSNGDLEYCKQHDTASTCQTCYSDYTLSKGKCISCLDSRNYEGCLACSPGTTTTDHVCTQCQDGYYLASTTATQCTQCNNTPIQTGCICDTTGKCTQCRPGFYSQSTTSVVCEICPDSNCSSCDPTIPQICNSCNVGYYLKYYDNGNTNTQNYCAQCEGDCAECDYQNSCKKCNTSSRLDSNTKTCISTGVAKSDGISALECKPRYTLQNGICTLCFVDGVSQCPTSCTDTASNGGGTTNETSSNIISAFLLIFLSAFFVF